MKILIPECLIGKKKKNENLKKLEYFENFKKRDFNRIIQKKKQEKELSECTFTPSHNLQKSQISKNEAEDFYKRNMEWKQKVEGQDSKKRDDYLKLVTVIYSFAETSSKKFPSKLSGEKQRNKQPSMDNRPTINDSNYLTEQNRFIKTQNLFPTSKESAKKPYVSSASTRSYSKKRGEEK